MNPDDEPPAFSRKATSQLDWQASLGPADGESATAPSVGGPSSPVRAPIRASLLALVAVVGAVAGAAGGAGVALLLDKDEVLSVPAQPGGVATQLSIEQTGAIVTVANDRRATIVRIESTRRGPSGIERDVGSGVIFDRAGHIVTNAHVVLGTETLKVILADGSERPAILVGHDAPFSDLAVLQIGPVEITPAPMGDSAALRLGEAVIAIGNPLSEFEGSVTVGVVSGVNRSRTFDGVRHDDYIQTDAALNNGNSGGGLFTLRGEFIGMPTLVLRLTASRAPVEGIGFAIPSATVTRIASAIIQNGGAIPRPTLGVEHLDLTPEVIQRAGRLSAETGALVTSVRAGGPGAIAGLQAGDIVQMLDAKPVDRDHPLLNGLAVLAPGDSVRVVLNRNGRIIEVVVRLGARES